MPNPPHNDVVSWISYVIPGEWVTNHTDDVVYVVCNECEGTIDQARPGDTVKGHTEDQCLVNQVMSG